MNLKAMIEKRNAKVEEMKAILTAAQTETRAFSDEETTKYEAIKAEIRSLDATIEAIEEAKKTEKRDYKPAGKVSIEEVETRSFENFIRGEIRSGEQNVTMGSNGAIVPTTIANRVIAEVKDLCPIFAKAEMYSVKGSLKIPVWGKANTSHDITVGYQSEFTEITADAGKFTSIDLSGYLAGALTLVGKSVINNGGVDVVSFVVTHMAEKIALFLEEQLLVGTGSSAAQGLVNTTNTVTTASGTAITADELITLQSKVKQAYQGNACWTMNSDTFAMIKKLKDSNNRYLLQDNVSSEFPYMLLGKPVYLSDNMPSVAAGAKAVLYADYSALAVNMRENIEIQLLTEKYATQHAIGVNAWFEFDSKIVNEQKAAVLVQKAS